MRVITCRILDACTLLKGLQTTTKHLYTYYQLVFNVGLLMLASTVTSFLSRELRTHRESLHGRCVYNAFEQLCTSVGIVATISYTYYQKNTTKASN